MSRLSPQTCVALLAIALGGGVLWWSSGAPTSSPEVAQALAAQEVSNAQQVTLELTIEDADSGLELRAKRKVPAGISGIDAMRGTVAIETKEFEGLGLFVTSLCGVKPADGKFWSPAVDGKKSQLGIVKIKIEQDTHLRWTTQPAAAP